MPLVPWLPGKTVPVQAARAGSGSSWMCGCRRRGIARTTHSRIAWASGPTGRPHPFYTSPLVPTQSLPQADWSTVSRGGSPFQDKPYNTMWQPFSGPTLQYNVAGLSGQTLTYNVAALFRSYLTIQCGSPFQYYPTITLD